ncbi:hypothetical protein [Priestia aryabhattai]|uniref:hypothetical protein n=1 Tax=Priestia aryabhattai TaxID=412384 RepID=UPI0030C8EE72
MIMEKSQFLGYLNKEFINNFVEAIKNYNTDYKKMRIEIMPALPKPFRNINKLAINTIYIENVDYLVIHFSSGNKFTIDYTIQDRNIFLESLLEAEEGVFYETSSIDEVLTQDTGGFVIYLSYEAFMKRYKEPKEFAHEIIRTNVDYYSEYTKFQLNWSSKDHINKDSYISNLKGIADQFHKLIYDENTPELTIDKFLEDNSIILKGALKLDKLKHQCVLENTLSKYAHDLRPDLIGYDTFEKNWVIVDYKKANKNLMKNIDKTRTGLKSEVHSLRDQLYDYVEYFDEDQHRKEFKKKYKVNVEHPSAIGIIGKLDNNLSNEFNRLLKNEPRWLKLIPYNYLYENFISFIESGEKFLEK